jgi:hypothetical protein
MRTLLMTLLLTAPLLAQEAEEKKPAKQDHAAALQKLLESFLESKDEKKIKEMEEHLRALLEEGQELNLEFKPLITGKEMRVVFGDVPLGGQETIAGSSDATSYTLKSLGGGRYKLTATQIAVLNGTTKQITDEGTLKELSKKHTFLKGMYAVDVPRHSAITMVDFGPVGRLVPETPRARLGMLVRPPSESLSHHLELPTGAGLVVGSVNKDSRAEKLGLKEHDVLLRIDGELIDSPDQLEKLAKDKGVLEYVRRGKPRKLDLAKVTGEK